MAVPHVREAGQVGATAGALACLVALRLVLGDDGLYLDGAMALAAGLGAWKASRRTRTPRSRRAWRFQLSAPLVWSVAPIVWVTGAPSDIASAARIALVVLVASAWWLTSRAGDIWSRVRLVVDGGVAAASVFIAGWAFALHEGWHVVAGGADAVVVVVALAVPVGGIWAATLAAGLAMTEMRGSHRVMPALYVAGMAVIAWSDVAWLTGRTPLWTVGFALFILGTHAYAGTSRRRELISTRESLTYAPYVLVSPAALALAVQSARGDIPAAEVAAAIVMVGLLLVRQHVTLVENQILVRRLAATELLLRHQATHDALTGLPGRVILWERLEEASARGGDASIAVAVVFVDLDEFKSVNDLHGHAAGDHLLVETARRLTAALAQLGDDALAVRMSGDEFAILLFREAAEQAAVMAQRILVAIQRPVVVNAVSVAVSASVGVASTESDTLNPSALLRAADVAMYDVKHHGKGGVRVAERDRRAL